MHRFVFNESLTLQNVWANETFSIWWLKRVSESQSEPQKGTGDSWITSWTALPWVSECAGKKRRSTRRTRATHLLLLLLRREVELLARARGVQQRRLLRLQPLAVRRVAQHVRLVVPAAAALRPTCTCAQRPIRSTQMLHCTIVHLLHSINSNTNLISTDYSITRMLHASAITNVFRSQLIYDVRTCASSCTVEHH